MMFVIFYCLAVVWLTFLRATWQEIRLGEVDMIRALFERAISLSLPTKKMKVCTSYIPSL